MPGKNIKSASKSSAGSKAYPVKIMSMDAELEFKIEVNSKQTFNFQLSSFIKYQPRVESLKVRFVSYNLINATPKSLTV